MKVITRRLLLLQSFERMEPIPQLIVSLSFHLLASASHIIKGKSCEIQNVIDSISSPGISQSVSRTVVSSRYVLK